jgi:transposase-like protein
MRIEITSQNKAILNRVVISVFRIVAYGLIGGGNMPKYTQEVKDKAVKMVQEGKSLKAIQTELGPNPKAVQRYLKKAGIDYTKIVEKQKAVKAAEKAKADAAKPKVEAPKAPAKK